MKIVSLFAAMPGNNEGLIRVKNKNTAILDELGVENSEINLAYHPLPYYDGMKTDAMEPLGQAIAESAGIILYGSASLGLPGALLQNLLEHATGEGFRELLRDKNIYAILLANDGYGQIAMSNLCMALTSAGAYDSSRLLIDNHFCQNLEEIPAYLETIERLMEDFYRITRQQRKLYRPVVFKQEDDIVPASKDIQVKYTPNEAQEVLSRLNIDSFNEAQEQDISEISKFFASRIKAEEENWDEDPMAALNKPVLPKGDKKQAKPTIKQYTQSLTHYFKPGHGEGLDVIIALNITGEDGFDGYFSITDGNCDFLQGQPDNPDVTIIAGDESWTDILKGKISAQKAFMIGQIKVRGNFVLLTKFDMLFDFDKMVF